MIFNKDLYELLVEFVLVNYLNSESDKTEPQNSYLYQSKCVIVSRLCVNVFVIYVGIYYRQKRGSGTYLLALYINFKGNCRSPGSETKTPRFIYQPLSFRLPAKAKKTTFILYN